MGFGGVRVAAGSMLGSGCGWRVGKLYGVRPGDLARWDSLEEDGLEGDKGEEFLNAIMFVLSVEAGARSGIGHDLGRGGVRRGDSIFEVGFSDRDIGDTGFRTGKAAKSTLTLREFTVERGLLTTTRGENGCLGIETWDELVGERSLGPTRVFASSSVGKLGRVIVATVSDNLTLFTVKLITNPSPLR